jgi:hypothetical protein
VTYPEVVDSNGAQCKALSLGADEVQFLHGLGQRLEDAFLATAPTANVVLVDAYAASSGHGPCAPTQGQRWVAGKSAPEGFPYHPTLAGHQAIASLVETALRHRSASAP